MSEPQITLINGLLETLLHYLAGAAVTLNEADVHRALIKVLPTLEERIMPTMVETWLERGRAQGVQAGEQRVLLC